MKYLIGLIAGSMLFLITSCGTDNTGPLPYYGNHYTNAEGETIYNPVRDFSFVDQDSQLVTQASFAGKIYLADFFFTSCPTICPKVAAQMLRIYDKYKDDDRVLLLSHTIDVRHDTVAKLKKYADGLGVEAPKWRFVTGNRDSIFTISKDYMSITLDAPDAPGGFDHSGWILLVDKDRYLRAYVDGTKAEKVDEFLKQIDQLLAEEWGEEL